jgi:hypothetical protein
MGLVFIGLGLRWTRLKKNFAGSETAAFSSRAETAAISMTDAPCRWLAIKTTNLNLVQEALGLNHPVACSLEDALPDLREHRLFLAPPVAGWILVVGSSLPDPADDVDRCFHFLSSLSRRLGHIQFFSANRILNHHGWALVDQGRVFRAYCWADETLWNQGPVTAAERDLNLCCFDYGTDRVSFAQRDALQANSEKVHRLAARWSLDPNLLWEKAGDTRIGIVGSLSHSKLS